MNELPRAIFRHWIHSQEEDLGEVEVYRPVDYPLPPVRGRTGFEINEKGEFILYDIAPTDGELKLFGHWRAIGAAVIHVTFERRGAQSLRLDIRTVENDLLKVRMNYSK